MTMLTRLHQYGLLIRWNKPIGTLLLLWPTLAALFLATQGKPSAALLVIFTAGVFVMRAAGCILNDFADLKFDKHVNRTKERPLTSGKIHLLEAAVILVFLLLVAFGLVLLLNTYSMIIAVVGVILSVVYPLTKRFFQLPQGVLGIVFNLGILMAYAASLNHIPLSGWMFFVIAVIWTVAYDSLYAMSDIKDDIKLGLNSSAIWFGNHDKKIIAALQLCVIVLLLIFGWFKGFDIWFYLGVAATTLTFVYQQLLIIKRKPELCLAAFVNNHWSWFFVFFGIYLSLL